MGSDRGDRLRGRRSLHLLRDRAPQVRARRRPPGDVHLCRRSNLGARRARPARRPRGHARSPRLQGDALGSSLARSLPSLLGWLGHLSSRWRRDRRRSCSARPPAARRRSDYQGHALRPGRRGGRARARGALECGGPAGRRPQADPARRDAEGLDRRRAGGRGPPVLRARRPRSCARCSAPRGPTSAPAGSRKAAARSRSSS